MFTLCRKLTTAGRQLNETHSTAHNIVPGRNWALLCMLTIVMTLLALLQDSVTNMVLYKSAATSDHTLLL